MFSDEELKAFYAGKESGYSEKEYTNPHLAFVAGIEGATTAEDRLHKQFKRGYDWGKAQKSEEDSK